MKSFKKILSYFVLVVMTLLILCVVMELWNADLSIPFSYDGDALFMNVCIKGVIDNGWYLTNEFLSAPNIYYLHDFPVWENLHYLIIRLIALLTGNFAITINLFYIITYPLVAVSSYFVLRKLNIAPLLSFAGAILYTFLPYHFFRGQTHLFLGSYFFVPLIILVIIWVYNNELEFITEDRTIAKTVKSILTSRKLAGSILICLGMSMTGIYYSFFACFFFMIIAVRHVAVKKKMIPAINALIPIAVMVASIIISMTPTILFQMEHGRNHLVPNRGYGGTEDFALKIFQLFMPVTGHRMDFLAAAKKEYNDNAFFVNENDFSSLGIVVFGGFLLMVAFQLFCRSGGNGHNDDRVSLLEKLSTLNIAAILLATMGGFGSIISPLIRYTIRAYNRMSIFIAFFSIVALLLVIGIIYDRYFKDKKKIVFSMINRTFSLHIGNLMFGFLVILMTALGLFDQTTAGFIPHYSGNRTQFMIDREFVEKIESILPPRSMIFQLPYDMFPEKPPIHKMTQYDHFRCYLHSKKLRWSYGAILGRETDEWQKSAASRPLEEMIRTIYAAGFAGIYINRNGYTDNGEDIIRRIKMIVKKDPIESKDNHLAFFYILDYKR